MPIDTYQPPAAQNATDRAATPIGQHPRPHFELDQYPLEYRKLNEDDFRRASMHPETREADEAALKLDEDPELDQEMFDKMNREQLARDQIAEAGLSTDNQTPSIESEDDSARLVAEYLAQYETMSVVEIADYIRKLSRHQTMIRKMRRDQFDLAA